MSCGRAGVVVEVGDTGQVEGGSGQQGPDPVASPAHEAQFAAAADRFLPAEDLLYPNVFRSCVYARTVFGRARLAANSKNSSTSRLKRPGFSGGSELGTTTM